MKDNRCAELPTKTVVMANRAALSPVRSASRLAARACETIANDELQGMHRVLVSGGKLLCDGPHRQLLFEGIHLNYTTLRNYVSRMMVTYGLSRQRINAAKPPRQRVPSSNALLFALMTDSDRRTPTEQIQVVCLRKLNTEVAKAIGLVETSTALIRKSSRMTWRGCQLKA